MIEKEKINVKVNYLYGRDGLYLNENEKESNNVESDDEKIDVRNYEEIKKKYDK